MILAFTFSDISEVSMIWSVGVKVHFLSSLWTFSYSSTVLKNNNKNTILFTHCFVPLFKIEDSVSVNLFLALSSISLIFLSVPYYLDYYNFMLNFEVR